MKLCRGLKSGTFTSIGRTLHMQRRRKPVKPVVLSPVAVPAMKEEGARIVLNTKFVDTIRAVYRNGRMHRLDPPRVIPAVHVALIPRRGVLVPWTHAAIDQALNYLADQGAITLPHTTDEPVLASR